MYVEELLTVSLRKRREEIIWRPDWALGSSFSDSLLVLLSLRLIAFVLCICVKCFCVGDARNASY